MNLGSAWNAEPSQKPTKSFKNNNHPQRQGGRRLRAGGRWVVAPTLGPKCAQRGNGHTGGTAGLIYGLFEQINISNFIG